MLNRINAFPTIALIYISGLKRGKSSPGHLVGTLDAAMFYFKSLQTIRY